MIGKQLTVLSLCLGCLVVSLLLVGVVSSTVVRHLVQVIAPAAVLFAVRRGAIWSSYAALPVFAFWLGIMALIWLYLLGLSSFASGTYTLTERALTIAIGASCLVGIAAVVRERPRVRIAIASLAIGCFAILQLLVMWLSFHPLISSD